MDKDISIPGYDFACSPEEYYEAMREASEAEDAADANKDTTSYTVDDWA